MSNKVCANHDDVAVILLQFCYQSPPPPQLWLTVDCCVFLHVCCLNGGILVILFEFKGCTLYKGAIPIIIPSIQWGSFLVQIDSSFFCAFLWGKHGKQLSPLQQWLRRRMISLLSNHYSFVSSSCQHVWKSHSEGDIGPIYNFGTYLFCNNDFNGAHFNSVGGGSMARWRDCMADVVAPVEGILLHLTDKTMMDATIGNDFSAPPGPPASTTEKWDFFATGTGLVNGSTIRKEIVIVIANFKNAKWMPVEIPVPFEMPAICLAVPLQLQGIWSQVNLHWLSHHLHSWN